MLKQIQERFRSGRIMYTKHAKDEMEGDESGEIRDQDIDEAVVNGKIIEAYPDDEPYPSCLVYGNTLEVLVCNSCGERYYDRATMKKIEEYRTKLKNTNLNMEEVGKIFRAHAV